MDIRTYILTFNVAGARMPDLQYFIQHDPAILAYWNHIPLVYCVKTTLGSAQLRDKVDPFFPQGGFFIGELKSDNLDGRLSEDAWKWFYAPPPLSGLAAYGMAQPSGLAGGMPPAQGNLLTGLGAAKK